MTDADDGRRLGLRDATGIGVGAIVGGGIFVLAGVAFAAAGPGAMLAFALNGVVAFLTAMSFAEISSAFPANGGPYTFAKKVLSLRAAFAVGWIMWFAYIVAGVLYALGFASFFGVTLRALFEAAGAAPPAVLSARVFGLAMASAATILYAIRLIRRAGGGGQWETVGKVVVFCIIIAAGLWALVRQPVDETTAAISPFLPGGSGGVLLAMGYTFIALQGFDLISAVGGEVKRPERNIPRAMFLSLGCALAIYLPLLFLVSSVGTEPGESVRALAVREPEQIIPLAAERMMGPTGYWLVLVAALLSTLSALQANLMAASRVALSMAADRTLPDVLADLHPERRTPVMAVYATALTLIAIAFMIPDLAAAGAASSLIFLVAFTLAHVTTFLARRRGGIAEEGYRTPWFPVVPVVGGLACAGLAVFQAVAVPRAGGVTLIWLGLGVILYWSIFARRAELGDAVREGLDPGLVALRGRSPLVLVPIANPAHAPALVEVANATASRSAGRVLLLSIVPTDARPAIQGTPPPATEGRDLERRLADTQEAVGEALRLSYGTGYRPEALITSAQRPFDEIRRVAETHGCESLLLGLGELPDSGSPAIEDLIQRVDADVALMKSPAGWRLSTAQRVLIPVGGRGDQHEWRARLLGSLVRAAPRTLTFVTVLPESSSDLEVARAGRHLSELASLEVPAECRTEVVRAADRGAALAQMAADYDLMILGLPAVGRANNVFGSFSVRLAREVPCAALFLSRRRRRALERLEPLRDDVLHNLRGGWRG
jgi:amino acid transporter